MKPFALVALLCAVPALHAQAVELNLGKKASLAAVALVDGAGASLTPDEAELDSFSTVTVPFVGIKTKIHFKEPKEVPAFSPVRLLLGKVDPEKTGGVRLAKLITGEGKPLLKAKIVFSLSIDDDCDPFKGSDHPKAKQDAEGTWVMELPKALEPGTYALVSATGSKGMFGVKVDAKARIFQVPAPSPAPAAAAAH